MIKRFIPVLLLMLLFFFATSAFAETTPAEGSPVVSAVQEGGHHVQTPPAFSVIPFVVLLLAIATGPLFFHHFWEKFYPVIAILLGLVTAFYYLVFLHDYVSLLHSMEEYLSFIALLASLFVASGGILIKVDKKATPALNAFILFFGSVIANLIGTTGASMLLIRPFMKINKDRIKPYHIVFFIFTISNVGGALTPIGDPPLFLGFLRGVNFFWTVTNVWYIWLPTTLAIIGVFYIIDSLNKSGSETTVNYSGKIEFRGMKNVAFLAIIIISVFIDPKVISWVPDLHPLPFGIREMIMFSVVYLAYRYADSDILKANGFEWEPIREVAYLFVGIFLTMVPALQLIAHEAKVLGDQLNAGTFYWGTGILSGFLDNAPTYLNFLSAEMGKFGLDVNNVSEVRTFVDQYPLYLRAISVAAVFFGAMTYIGNGPNFMVKSISERAGIRMPSFFGYIIKYSLPVLIPIYIIVWYVFFYGKG